ncbi:MAG: hypothetical protein PHQ86_08500 [Dehalococcoidales bacterium]|nr:hypothetical protein [Dehalococcoidales bacterium]
MKHLSLRIWLIAVTLVAVIIAGTGIVYAQNIGGDTYWVAVDQRGNMRLLSSDAKGNYGDELKENEFLIEMPSTQKLELLQARILELESMVDTQEPGDTISQLTDRIIGLENTVADYENRITNLETNVNGTNPVDPVDTGLILWLSMNEGEGTIVNDASLADNNGIINEASWISIGDGFGLSFDGVNSYIGCGNDTSLDITDCLTIESWVNVDTIKTSQFVGKRVVGTTAGGNYTFGLGAAGTRLVLLVNNTAYYSTSMHGFIEGEWNSVGVTVNESNKELVFYTNGIKLGDTMTLNETFITDEGDLQIGKGGLDYFSGSLDEIKVYKRELSAEEIADNFNQEKILFGK